MRSNPWKLDAPNTDLKNKIMEFSTAYFVVDLLHYLLANPSDHFFIFHHIATSFYLVTCRYYAGHGGLSAISLIAAGESTTPLQNVWTISRMAKTESSLANIIYSSVSPFFTVYFTVVRCIVGPWLAWKLASFYLAGKADAVIPYWMASSWMVNVILVLVGSTIWVYKLWTGLIHFYSKRGTPKGKLGAQKEEKKDIAAAAGKLAECQETILVLSKQLKALACSVDSMEFPYEAEKRAERDQRYELDASWSPRSQSASLASEPENISTANGRRRASEWTSESGLVAPDLYKVNVPDSPIVDYLDGRLKMHTFSDMEESSPAGSPVKSTQQRNKFTCFSSGSEFLKSVKTYGGESPTSSLSSSSLASTFFSKS